MNIVIVKYDNYNKFYLFSVSDDIILKKGDLVRVRNKRGEASATCTCDSFELDDSPLEALVKVIGAKMPLQPVIGRYRLVKFETEGVTDNG